MSLSLGAVRTRFQPTRAEWSYASLLLAALAITAVARIPIIGAAIWYVQTIVAACTVLAGIIVRYRFRHPQLPAREGYRWAWNEAREGVLANDRLLSYAWTVLLIPLYLGAFTGWKTLVTTRGPFVWDAALMCTDRWLHGGADPWRLFNPLLSSPIATHTLVTVYAYGWTLAMHGCLAYAALTRRPRFLLANMLAWPIAGVLCAGLVLSAGPAFYGVVVGADGNPYAELVAHHQAINSAADYWQRYLWSVYQSGTAQIGSGISAFPSMHLVGATLCACVMWGLGRAWRIVGVLLVIVLLIGSIATGWHYAVDGYAGIAFGLLFWWLAGRV